MECIICLNEISINDYYNLNCCNNNVHIICLNKWIKNNINKKDISKCFICSQDNDIIYDITSFNNNNNNDDNNNNNNNNNDDDIIINVANQSNVLLIDNNITNNNVTSNNKCKYYIFIITKFLYLSGFISLIFYMTMKIIVS